MTRSDAATTILALERRRHQAMIASDLHELDVLCSTHLTYTHATSVRDDKASYLAKFAAGHYAFGPITTSGEQVVIVTGGAVVTGRMTCSLVAGGVPKDLDNTYTAVWTDGPGDWQLVAFQSTPIPSAHR